MENVSRATSRLSKIRKRGNANRDLMRFVKLPIDACKGLERNFFRGVPFHEGFHLSDIKKNSLYGETIGYGLRGCPCQA